MTTTQTPVALYIHTTPSADGACLATLAESMARLLWARRDALLRELATIEAELGLGCNGKLTTAQIRERWRECGGHCPECGAKL